jgi:hypothetical protein
MQELLAGDGGRLGRHGEVEIQLEQGRQGDGAPRPQGPGPTGRGILR